MCEVVDALFLGRAEWPTEGSSFVESSASWRWTDVQKVLPGVESLWSAVHCLEISYQRTFDFPRTKQDPALRHGLQHPRGPETAPALEIRQLKKISQRTDRKNHLRSGADEPFEVTCCFYRSPDGSARGKSLSSTGFSSKFFTLTLWTVTGLRLWGDIY